MEKIGFRIPLILALGLFGVSLFLPIYAEGSGTGAKGWLALFAGWGTAASDPITAISWFGNVAFIIGVILILRRKNPRPMATLVFAIAAVVLGCFFLGRGASFGAGNSAIMTKSGMGSAFFAWMGSFILLALAAWIKFKKR